MAQKEGLKSPGDDTDGGKTPKFSKFSASSSSLSSKFLAKTPTTGIGNRNTSTSKPINPTKKPPLTSASKLNRNTNNTNNNNNTNTFTRGSTNDNNNNNNNDLDNNDNNDNNIIDDDDSHMHADHGMIDVRDRLGPKPNTDFNENDGRDIKVLKDHQLPLQYRWTLWHTAPKSKGGRHNKGGGGGGAMDHGWTDSYKKIAEFDTVSTFWQLFSNIAPPSMLQAGSTYHLFKGKVKPKWEDSFNEGGGSWTYRFGSKGREREKGGGNAKEDISNILNYAWYYTVLNMIGNNFQEYGNICGIVVSVKPQHRHKIELWLKNAHNRESVISIGNDFKTFSGARKRKTTINFISHDDNKHGNRNRSLDL